MKENFVKEKKDKLRQIIENLSEDDYIMIHNCLDDVFGESVLRISINIEKAIK